MRMVCCCIISCGICKWLCRCFVLLNAVHILVYTLRQFMFYNKQCLNLIFCIGHVFRYPNNPWCNTIYNTIKYRPSVSSVSLTDQSLSRYKVVLNCKWTEWPLQSKSPVYIKQSQSKCIHKNIHACSVVKYACTFRGVIWKMLFPLARKVLLEKTIKINFTF